MIEQILFGSPWPGIIIWIILYMSDYLMTILSAIIYQSRIKDYFTMEGSYEITPYYQADINSLKWISPRFIKALIISCILIGILWWLTHKSFAKSNELYELILGSLILLELTIHIRHFRNLYQFKTAYGSDGIQGKIFYPRTVILRLSSFDMLLFTVLYLIIFLITSKYFLLGGSVACLSTAAKHRKLLKKYIDEKRLKKIKNAS